MKINDIFKKARMLEKDMVSKYNDLMVSLAKNIIVQVGINQLMTEGTSDALIAEYNKRIGDHASIIAPEFYADAVNLAVDMAKLSREVDGMKLLMCLLMPGGANEPVDGDICPICGEALEVDGDQGIVDDGTLVNWECPGCGATGKQGNNIIFEQHYEVRNANGDEVDPADFAY